MKKLVSIILATIVLLGLLPANLVQATIVDSYTEIDSNMNNTQSNICELMVAIGGSHVVGLKRDGTVVAVGGNAFGQCNVSGWSGIVQIAASGLYTLGLKMDGTVLATGLISGGFSEISNWRGIVQIAAGSYQAVGLKQDGTAVSVGNSDYCNVNGWTGIIQVAAGTENTIGLKQDGTVVVVGDNSYGQFAVSGWSEIIQVAAGSQFIAGLKQDGTVITAGRNNFGQGNVAGWSGIQEISCGRYNTIGLKQDGTVVGTGENDFGQCEVSDWSEITQITSSECVTAGLKQDGTIIATGDGFNGQCDVMDWSDIKQVDAGSNHSVAIRQDGTVIATGSNDYGQCNVSSWTGITQVSACTYHTVGLKQNGTVVATGRNNYGQCNVGSWTGIIQVSAGLYYTLGLKNDGTVVGVGINVDHQIEVGGWFGMRQVSAGHYHTAGLKQNGTVLAIGLNSSGECNTVNWSGITQISLGYSHTVGLEQDGTVVATGRNNYGQCNVGSWTELVQIDAGLLHTVGLKQDGAVIAVGHNNHCQCNVKGWSGITQVSAGGYHTLGLKQDGTVVAAGLEVELAKLDLDGFPMQVTTGEASDVTTDTVTLHGSLDNLGDCSSAEVSFEWRLAESSNLVVPSIFQSVEAPGNNCFPFCASQARFQQVYSASELGSSGIIDKISFRLDEIIDEPGFANQSVDIEVRLSHVTYEPDDTAFTANFTTNINTGRNETLVLDGVVDLSSVISQNKPNPFDIILDVDDLFPYNGTDNLLMDIKIISNQPDNGYPIFVVDATENTQGDSVASLYSSNISSPFGTRSSIGLITQFDLIPFTYETTSKVFTSAGNLSTNLTGLSSYKPYYFRIKAVHGTTIVYGEKHGFTTLLSLLVISTSSASNITFNSAVLNGNMNNMGDYSSVNVSFEWGKVSGNLEYETTQQTINTSGNVSAVIFGLNPSTTYFYRAKAFAGEETVYGDELSFTTQDIVEIHITPVNPEILSGRKQQFSAIKKYSDNTTEDITNKVVWTSSVISIATIDTLGSATGLIGGTTVISATMGEITSNTTLTVVPFVCINSGDPIGLLPDGNIPCSISEGVPVGIIGLPSTITGNGLSRFSFDITWDPQIVNLHAIAPTAEAIADGWEIYAQDNEAGNITVSGVTSQYSFRSINLFNIGLVTTGNISNISVIRLTANNLKDKYDKEIKVSSSNTKVMITCAGDVFSDGIINILDITKIARIILRINTEIPVADANKDGYINVLDLTRIARTILGLE